MRRVLKPNGLLTFTSYGRTLRELRSAWAQADGGAHVLPFIDMHDLGDAMGRHGFASPVLDVERITLSYASVSGVLADLKATGARNALTERARGLTSCRAKCSACARPTRNSEIRDACRRPMRWSSVMPGVTRRRPRRASARAAHRFSLPGKCSSK